MNRKIIQIIVTSLLLTTIIQDGRSAEEYTCECEFDTDEYEAIGYFAGTCSYTMDETRKKCKLQRAEDYDDIEQSLIKSGIFSDPMGLRGNILPLVKAMYQSPHALLRFAPEDFFSFLMRSSYLAAPFLDDRQKSFIDKRLLAVLGKHGKDMLLTFLGLHMHYIDKTFGEMYVAKGTARFTVEVDGRKILVCTKVLPRRGE